nr:proline-, glutamic acid- and leucine-rich protein 1-like [Ipomoea batatas]
MLLKQSSSRNLRAKGFKLKHGVQICVILAICIWLLYQVNKSYSKKGAIEGSGSECHESRCVLSAVHVLHANLHRWFSAFASRSLSLHARRHHEPSVRAVRPQAVTVIAAAAWAARRRRCVSRRSRTVTGAARRRQVDRELPAFAAAQRRLRQYDSGCGRVRNQLEATGSPGPNRERQQMESPLMQRQLVNRKDHELGPETELAGENRLTNVSLDLEHLRAAFWLAVELKNESRVRLGLHIHVELRAGVLRILPNRNPTVVEHHSSRFRPREIYRHRHLP